MTRVFSLLKLFLCALTGTDQFFGDRAKAVEEELRGIADRQQVNVNKLVELVKENEEMLAKMQVRAGMCATNYV